MKKRLVSFFVIVILLTFIFIMSLKFHTVKAEPETIYIRADGSIDPIMANITSADNVTYTFTDNIFDSIVVERDNILFDGEGYTLQGANAPGSIGTDMTGRSNVTIENTNIRNYWYGIYLSGSSNSRISGNNITNNYNGYGILLDSSSGNTISGNNITNNYYYGILLDSSSGNTISGNNITANNGYGILLGDSSGNSISGNKFTNNGLFVRGSYQNSVENNIVNGEPLVYLEGVSNYTVDDGEQVILVRCENIRVEGLNLSRTAVGVELLETSNSTISGNNITTNYYYGIYLYNSSSNTISGNNVTANSDDGILLDSSSGNSISENNMTSNLAGIYLRSSPSNGISGNNITNNWAGICLLSSSGSNISGNNIASNGYGILLDSSSNNSIFHNNFINNGYLPPSPNDSVNVWDEGYPSGGNYWSDYSYIDMKNGPYQNETGSDGIGDTSYIIDANNVDNYPLMAPISFFNAGTWNGTAYYVDIVSNSSLSHFHFNPDEGTFASFWVKGEMTNETIGFCRVAIPKNLLWVEDGWTVLYGSAPLTYKTFFDKNCTYLYFTYTNPYQNVFTTVTINGTHTIPEFPIFLFLPLFFIATLLAVIAYRRHR